MALYQTHSKYSTHLTPTVTVTIAYQYAGYLRFCAQCWTPSYNIAVFITVNPILSLRKTGFTPNLPHPCNRWSNQSIYQYRTIMHLNTQNFINQSSGMDDIPDGQLTAQWIKVLVTKPYNTDAVPGPSLREVVTPKCMQ